MNLTSQDVDAIKSLHSRGFAVCVFHPGQVDEDMLDHIEECMNQAAWLASDPEDEGTPVGRPIVYNDELAADIYEEGGQSAVIDAARAGVLRVDTWGPCEPCDDDQSPIADGCCLVCVGLSANSC